MVTRTFIDKCTTIFMDNSFNYGLNPIAMLNYGQLISRVLIHFDEKGIQELVASGSYPDKSLLRHLLKMKNCGSIQPHHFDKKVPSADMNGVKERATSFDIIAFVVPQVWDEGIGFDNSNDFWITGKSALSQDGATWYNATNEELWNDSGIYSNKELAMELDNYRNGKESIVIAEQHFDHGNEDLELDITDYVNGLLSGNTNYGLCIAFSPEIETKTNKYTQYVGFFNNKTNTIYEPVVETRYNCEIKDDRMDFILGRTNKLYLYSRIDGVFTNLDELPMCSVEGIELPVSHETRGVYSVTLKLSPKDYKKDMILSDVWSNLKYNGDEIDDVEMDFVTKPSVFFTDINEHVHQPHQLNPILVGVKDFEKLNKGDVRGIKVFFKEPYKHQEYRLVNDAWYKIYVKDGDREVDIIQWDKLLKLSTCNYFYIKTDELVPCDYHVDIKVKIGDEIKVFKDELQFKIVSDLTGKRI